MEPYSDKQFVHNVLGSGTVMDKCGRTYAQIREICVVKLSEGIFIACVDAGNDRFVYIYISVCRHRRENYF